MGSRGREARAAAEAASIGISAALYLLDVGTNISTLRSYYEYEYLCPHASPASSLVRHDPICRAILSGYSLHNIPTQFWECLTVLLVAHLAYPLLFLLALPRLLHPFRFAYFLPLVRLYSLLKLLCHTFNFKGIEKLQEEHRHCNSLYNALGASLETVPQLIIQSHVAMKLGQYIQGSTDPYQQVLRIPKNLLLSLIASLASGTYNATMAVLLLLEEDIALWRKMSLFIIVGSQTLAVIILKTTLSSAFAQFDDQGFSTPLLIYILSGFMVAWPFCGLLLQVHGNYCQQGGGKQRLLQVAHSFGLALMTILIGPIYIVVKHKTKSIFLIWGVLLHILVDIFGIFVVLLCPGNLTHREGPCHPLKISDLEEQKNHYLTCHVFLWWTTVPSLVVVFLTTIFFLKCHNPGGSMAKLGSNISMDMSCRTDSSLDPCIPQHDNHSSTSFEDEEPPEQSTSSIFKLLLLCIVILLLIQKPPTRSL